MTVKIEGMEMPKSCSKCRFCTGTCCTAGEHIVTTQHWKAKTRPSICPLKELDMSRFVEIVPPPTCCVCPALTYSRHLDMEYCAYDEKITSKTVGMSLSAYPGRPKGCPKDAEECK